MTRKQVERYIEHLNTYGSVLGLDSMRRLCERFELPMENLPVIHIAGTNGKGSTLAFVSTILTEAGYRVGRYLSPTIMEYRERFQINGRMITWKALGRYMAMLKQTCDELTQAGFPHPTAFESETALALLYFIENRCDFMVLETGLGGSLDATNIIPSSLVSVLASISMDHMAFLGDTLEKIAEQKCGIIKEGCPVVSQCQPENVLGVIKRVCAEKSSSLRFVDEEEIKIAKYGIEKQKFSYREYRDCEIHLAGVWQIKNAALALEVVSQLKELGYGIPQRAVYAGLQHTQWHGRFEVIGRRPLFIADGAHNAEAAEKLADSIRFYFTNKKIIYIMGVLKDKEYEKIIRSTYALAHQIITVKTPDQPRAMDAYELAGEVRRFHPHVTMADSIEEAVEMAYLLADKSSVIVAFGSLSYLGDLIRAVRRKNDDPIRV